MIQELFLACALAVPSLFSTQFPVPDKHEISVLRMLSAFYNRGPYDDLHDSSNGKHSAPRVVVVSDTFDYVAVLRRMGIQAWQLSPFSGTSRWSIQGDLRQSPIKPGSVHLAWATDPVRHVLDLLQMMWMVREFGFLIIQLPGAGHHLLRSAGFEHFPFEWGSYEIWRRSA